MHSRMHKKKKVRLEHSDEKNEDFQVMKRNVTIKVGIVRQYMSA